MALLEPSAAAAGANLAAAAGVPVASTVPLNAAQTLAADSVAASERKQSMPQRLWLAFAAAAHPYFFAGPGERDAQGNRDMIVEVARQDPTTAGQLIRSAALFSTIGNVAVGLACAFFLGSNWSQCKNCDRPLRWWLLVTAVFQASQLPVRVVLLVSLSRAMAEGRSVEAQLASLTASAAWRLSKTVAFVQYGWFVLGMVWWMHLEACPGCAAISKLTAAVMVFAAARAVTALVVFRVLFPPGGNAGAEARTKAMPAAPEVIASIPVERFSMKACSDSQAMCAICLADYDTGAVLRRLPCGHDFHKKCVDKWLVRNRRCPLCLHAVDEAYEAAPSLRNRSG